MDLEESGTAVLETVVPITPLVEVIDVVDLVEKVGVEVVDLPEIPVVDEALSSRLLSMADRYRNEGEIHQALEIYWTLIDEYSDTSQAKGAATQVMEIAEEFDRDGARRMARSIFERLLTRTD